MKTAWCIIFFAVLIWSGINPKDYMTWLLEVFPAIIGFMVIALTHKSFPLTRLCAVLILIHCIILMVGGHYTYAEVPLFNWIKEWFNMERNNYDKLGHLAQGFIPAIVAREIVVRKEVIDKQSWWLEFFIICFCLGLSAFYELIEWWVALLSGESAEAFLGTQGYAWDTQSDMAWALFGAITALLLLSRLHDRQLTVVSDQS
jgi:putative membrane protein